jgi:hypothetical protein
MCALEVSEKFLYVKKILKCLKNFFVQNISRDGSEPF